MPFFFVVFASQLDGMVGNRLSADTVDQKASHHLKTINIHKGHIFDREIDVRYALVLENGIRRRHKDIIALRHRRHYNIRTLIILLFNLYILTPLLQHLLAKHTLFCIGLVVAIGILDDAEKDTINVDSLNYGQLMACRGDHIGDFQTYVFT